MDATAQATIDMIRRRNRFGSVEGIAGFNLAYNDEKPAPVVAEVPVKAYQPVRTEDGAYVFFRHSAERAKLAKQHRRKCDPVMDSAAKRSDHKALRASDGAPRRSRTLHAFQRDDAWTRTGRRTRSGFVQSRRRGRCHHAKTIHSAVLSTLPFFSLLLPFFMNCSRTLHRLHSCPPPSH